MVVLDQSASDVADDDYLAAVEATATRQEALRGVLADAGLADEVDFDEPNGLGVFFADATASGAAKLAEVEGVAEVIDADAAGPLESLAD